MTAKKSESGPPTWQFSMPPETNSVSTDPSNINRAGSRAENKYREAVDKGQNWPDNERANSPGQVMPLRLLVQTEPQLY